MATKTAKSIIPTNDELKERWESLRTHKRATASVRFQLEWQEGEKLKRANGVTVDVSRTGCMAVVAADVPLRQRVLLIRPDSGRSIVGEVVWRGHEAWDVGIALTLPDESFWAAAN